MKILVTGGAGFIGSNVVDAYVELGHEVLVADDLSMGKTTNVNARAALHQLDVASPELVELVLRERPDVINHHAAQTSVRTSVENPLDDARRNILASLNVLEACRQAGVGKLIYISSGGAIYGEPVALPATEDNPIRADSPYGISKHTPEHYLDVYHRLYGQEYTVLRYGNVYGPRQDPFGEAGVIAIFTQRMLDGEQPIIYGSGEQERDFVFVGDVVAANVAALERGAGQAFNIGMGVATTINQLYTLIASATGYPNPVAYAEGKPGETFRIYLDISRARETLGWSPQVSLEDGLGRTVESLRT